ncbi:MAG TPA: Gfo/Idh/MocA family oxidoreductase [Gemmataceae bacterium]|nr:Gfo/Idh/MocA family oxidoreductase [Gemmataceae bacterium]
MSSIATTADIANLVEPAEAKVSEGSLERIPVAIVGAGYIATYHLAVLRQLGGVEVVGACDPSQERLDALCKEWQIANRASNLEELLRVCKPKVVHVLVPPAFHYEVTRQALQAGLHVLVEKPMALAARECEELIQLAERRQLHLGVNHNAVFHPAFQRLLADVAAGKLGRVEHVVSINNLPLAQLESGEHDHWMFREPTNVLFEQGPHPLSQICELLGEVQKAGVTTSGRRQLRTRGIFESTWQMSLGCARGTADLFLSFGRTFPEAFFHVVGQDGAAHVDLINNTYQLDQATKYIDAGDRFLRRLRQSWQICRGGLAGFLGYGLSTLGIVKRTDPYYQSMLGCARAYYAGFKQAEKSPSSAQKGLWVIQGLEDASGEYRNKFAPPSAPHAASGTPGLSPKTGDVLVLGGTGFIGRHLVKALKQSGRSARLLARRPSLVPYAGTPEQPAVIVGDIRQAADVARAVDGCSSVIHLVSGAPATWAEYERLFVGGTRNVAKACLEAKVPQLLFVSSIAALDLGKRGRTITDDTPIDAWPERRAEYTRAKVACERLLLEMHAREGLPVTILRPGVVVGEGGPVEHLGVGFWPSRTHCVSWGRSVRHPLPFVLASDVADALVCALGKTDLNGKAFNLIGDVRLSADEYLQSLRAESGRRIVLHRQAIWQWFGIDLIKWAIKAVARKPGNAFPSRRDLASRSLISPFDTTQTKQLLGWRPVSDRERFIDLGIRRAVAGKPVE